MYKKEMFAIAPKPKEVKCYLPYIYNRHLIIYPKFILLYY